MEFEELMNLADISAVQEEIEKSQEAVYESRLMQCAFGRINFAKLSPLEQYRRHFVLMHILHNMAEEYSKQNLYLHVHFMRIVLTPFPEPGKCRHFDDVTLLFCKQNTAENSNMCAFHSGDADEASVEELSIKYFYLDKQNFYRLDEKSAESFFQGALDLLAEPEEIDTSLEMLGLRRHDSIDTLKKTYRKLAKEHHPDKSDSNTDKFMEINKAYTLVLSLFQGRDRFR